MAPAFFHRTRGRRGGTAWLVLFTGAIAACSSAYGAAEPAPPAPSCALDCGGHGTCSGAGDGARCVCEPNADGPDCRGCAAGFDHDPAKGTCVSRCALAQCGPHSSCTIANGEPICGCTAGYTRTTTACTWSGGPLDPTFENKPAGAWKLEGGATIDPTAKGSVSPGTLTFSSASHQRVSQTFAMPAFADAEPLALDVSSFCGGPGPFACEVGYDLGLNGRFDSSSRPPPSFGGVNFTLDRFCLGERAFGGALTLSFTPLSSGGSGQATRGLDHASIVPAAECPALAKIPNADFDTLGGWKADGTGAEIAVGVGTAGSRAGHLAVAKRCDSSSLTNLISVPAWSMKSPALTMTVKGTRATSMSATLSGTAVAMVEGTGVFEKVSICLPQWSRGLVMPLQLGVYGGSGGDTCSDAIPAIDFVVDDLTIASEPACSEPGFVVNGDFEQRGSAQPWITSLQGATLQFATGPSAHGGTGYAALLGNATCDLSSITQVVTVPDAAPGMGGPQLRFWYQATGTNARFSGAGDLLPATTGWTQHTRCLDPASAGRPAFVGLDFEPATTGCSYPRLLLDDVDVVHAKSCPE